MSKHRLFFQKRDTARYISHLDLMRTFQRAFQRAGLEVWHTEGFNPHAFVSLPLPLSVGFSSDCEILEFELLGGAQLHEVPERLTRALPRGIQVLQCYEIARPIRELAYVDYAVNMIYDGGIPSGAAAAMAALTERDTFVVQKPSKKAKSGVVALDIIPLIRQVTFTEDGGTLCLRAILAAQNPGLNPQILVSALIGEGGGGADYVSYHRIEVLDAALAAFR